MTAKITPRPQHGDVLVTRDDWPTVLVVRGYLRPRIEVATDRHRNAAEHRDGPPGDAPEIRSVFWEVKRG